MKVKVALFIILLSSLSIVACTDEAQESYTRLQNEMQNFSLDDATNESVEHVLSRIQIHLSKYPDHRQNATLLKFRKSIILQFDNRLFQQIVAEVEQVENGRYTDYETAIHNFEGAKEMLESYISTAKVEANIQVANSKIAEIADKVSRTSDERNEYYAVINTGSVEDIETFIDKYPGSVMKHALIEKIDEIYYTEFLENFNANPRTIRDLNASKGDIESTLGRMRGIDIKTKVAELMNGIEAQRPSVLEMELQDNMQGLLDRMETEAKRKAENTRTSYDVETCAARSSIPEVVGYSSTIERLYQVNMIGSFFGIDKRELMIVVSGKITGDLQRGVTISVTGSRIQSDTKY